MTNHDTFARAVALHEAGELDAAAAAYAQVLRAAPAHADALHLSGVIAHQRGRHQRAVDLIGAAIRLRPEHGDALNHLGLALHALGRHDEAIAVLSSALRVHPGHAEAMTHLGLVLRSRHGVMAAVAYFRQALAALPTVPWAWNALANGLRELGQMDDAIGAHHRARALAPELATLHGNLGNTLLGINRHDQAAAAYRAALALKPGMAEPLVGLLGIAQSQCDFDTAEICRRDVIGLAEARDETRADWRVLGSLAYRHLFSRLPEATYQAMSAAIDRLLQARFGDGLPQAAGAVVGGRGRSARIKLGFLSTSFGNHAVGQVAQDLFAALDHDRFELHGFSRWDRSAETAPYHARIRAAFDGFHEVGPLAPPEIARRIRAAGIDILVDLHGYMDHAGPEILAQRAAPVQVFWLGHAGGLAVRTCDYLIADAVTVPPGEEGRYLQRVVRLPDIYHCASPHPIAAAAPSRAQCGLPAAGFVFCAFNNPEKIDRVAFDAWMDILRAVEGGVLWLSDPGDVPARRANLRAAAVQRGVDPDRLVFAGWAPDKDSHLARHAHAGLLLDTLTVNASTTALDALWAGCPVLTLRGPDFAGRIAETMVRAIGLDDMACADLAGYRARAIALARDPHELAAIKARLRANRASYPLFNIPRFARHLGHAFATMWRWHEGGEGPRSFDVAAI